VSWENLELKPHDSAAQELERERFEQLQVECHKALDQPNLRQHLQKIALSTSYSPGRSPADVAYVEGSRALAAQLLNLGGKTP